uniref:(northern house mosquito) hypothetical protein n=1 Tax=Culex pipiens TaxID=7175 RepID=A0A8D8FPK3_CULPI
MFFTRKWAGVSADRSLGSSDRRVRGREFIQPSIAVSTVVNSSKDSSEFPSCRTRCFLATLTAASQRPPKLGARGGIRCHWMPSSARCLAILSLSGPGCSIWYSW